MKATHKTLRLFSLLVALFLLFSFASCKNTGTVGETTDENTAEESTDTTTDNQSIAVDKTLPIHVTVLNGTTGFGMAKLMQDKANGSAALNYTFDVQADASNVSKSLINGSTDIAALPTNAAATVYEKTNGGVQILALNTLGVLYLVGNSESGYTETLTMDALVGKTVYCPANNPAVIFNALCAASGLEVGTDIIIDTTYASPAALRNAVAEGRVDLAVLPEPMVTIAQKSNTALKTVMDITAVWDTCFPEGSLAQGCVVVRTEFAAAHPAEVAAFLTEYEASIRYMRENPEEAAEVVVAQGVFAGAVPIAAEAIPKCNVTFIAGKEMKTALAVFYEALNSVDSTSPVPGDSFYYGVTE